MSTTGNPFGVSNTRAQAAAQLPNFAQLFTADPTYKNFRGLNQQFTQIANAFGQGNSPFSLQDIQEGASAFQQAVNPYAQQFSEQSNREALALRMAEQQQLAAQGQGSPMQQAAFAQPAYSPAFPSSFPQQSPYSNFYGSPQLQNAVNKQYGGGNQNVIPLEGRFSLVRLAGGGEVSEARRMLQNLQNANEVQAGQMINRFAGGGYAAGRFNRAMVEPDAITGRGDRNLFELFDRNDRAMIAPVGPNEDGGFGPPAYTAPAPAPIAEPQLQKDGFLPLLRPVLPPAPVEQVQGLIQEGRVPSNYVTGPYDAQGLSDEDMTRWIAGTYEPGGANAPGALPYIFAPDYVDPLQKAYEQAQENAARAYQEVLDKRAAEQPPSPPPMAEPLPPPVAEPLPPPVAEPLPPPVAEPTPEPPPVAEPPGGIVTLPERPPVAELPRISPPEPPPAIPEPPPPITLPEIKERPVEPIKVPKVDEEFRSSPVRSFDPVTGSFRYTPPTKLDSATGAGTTWTPPTITSRKRQLLNVDYLPGIDVPQYDPLTNQLYQPALSASQRFAGDRNMQMAALQQLKTASPMSSATYLALQSRLRAGEFGGIGGQPVDMERLKAAATAMVPPVPGLKIGSVSDTAGGSQGSNVPAGFGSGVPVTLGVPTIGRNAGGSQGSNVPAGFGSGVPVTLGVPTIGRKDGGEVSTEDFIKKQSGGDVSRGTSEVPQLDAEGRLIDEREEIRSESQRMLNRLQSQPSKLPPGLRRIVAATKAQGTESMFPAAAPARDLLSGIIGASPTAPGSEAYRTGQALANMPPVQAAAAIPAKIAASAGDAATALAAMGPAMGAVVKPKGGNWLANAISDEMQNLKLLRFGNDPVDTYEDMKNVYTPEVMSRLSPETLQQVKEGFAALKPQVAINKWIDTKLAKYMQNEFATPEDPVRALIERGISPARNPGDINPIYDYNNVFEKRKKAGFPVEGLAETEAGRNWEEMADSSVNVSSLKDLLSSLKEGQESKYGISRVEANRTLRDNPWLSKLTLPDTPIYGALGANYRPVFNHVIDELQNAMATNSGLPKNLQLDPDDLSKMNVPQVVELVDKINKWRVDNIKNLQLEETLKADLYKAYPEQKYRWVQLNRPGQFAAESDAMGHSVRGYEPPDKGGSEYYGIGGFQAIQSGEAKVYSLRDEKGQPHVTIEVEANPQPYPVSGEAFAMLDPQTKAQYRQHVMEWRRRNPEIEELTDDDVAQALREAGVQPMGDMILQIKGKGNGAPAEKYLPFIQDFVKSGNWSEVNDLQNTGLIVVKREQHLPGSTIKINPGYYTLDELRQLAVDNNMSQDMLNEWMRRLNAQFRSGAYKNGGEVNVPRETSTSKQQLDKLAQVSKRKKA
jgi:hypothetical protein